MTDIALDFQNALAERNYTRSCQLITGALTEGLLPDLIAGLRSYEEGASLITLEMRDHVFHSLDMWDIYFAVQISSIDVLRILQENEVGDNPQTFMIDFVRDLFAKNDRRFDPFCINIQTISNGHYAILVQPIIEQRTEELLKCKIPFRDGDGPRRLYSAADLLDTYYGRKIVAAAHSHTQFDIILGEQQFETVKDSLESSGFDISTMLVEMDQEEWEKYVKRRRMAKDIHTGSSPAHPEGRTFGELIVLRRVKSARTNIYSSVFQRQDSALRAIQRAKTQRCNDVLMDVASDSSHPMRKRAIHELGEIGDGYVLNFLSDLMTKDGEVKVQREAARAYSRLSSRAAGMELGPPVSTKTPPVLDIAKINETLYSLIAKGMPTAMIDEAISSVAIQGSSKSVEIFLRLLRRPQVSVRLAVIKATKLLDKPDAAMIIRIALEDESEEVVRLAEKEIDTRWSDDVWE